MVRQLKLATLLAIALCASGSIDSAQAHIGGRGGGGIRIGGGLIPRAKLGNGNRNGGNAPAVQPAPKTVVVPPVVPIGGTKNSTVTKPPVAAPTNTKKPSVGNVAGSNGVVKSSAPTQVQAPVPAKVGAAAVTATAREPQPKKPSNSPATQQEHLVFNLTGNAAPEATNEADPAGAPAGLPSETKKALEEILATDAPAEETTPGAVKPVLATADFVRKNVALPQIPVGSTVTLNGKDLSEKEGQVVLQIGEIAMPATITAWKNSSVTCTLPVLGLTKASKATLHVLKADGKTASMLECELVTTLPTGTKANP